jgi:hypothetical protein
MFYLYNECNLQPRATIDTGIILSCCVYKIGKTNISGKRNFIGPINLGHSALMTLVALQLMSQT